MRENESDHGDGWTEPYDYISPWAAGETADTGLRPESGPQDTIDFGALTAEAGGPGQGSYFQRDRPDPWYREESRSAGGGWDPGPPPRRARRRGHLLIYLTVAAVAAIVGAGLTVSFGSPASSPSAGISASRIPSPRDDVTGSGPALNKAAVERKVEPGLVDITSTLKYQSETAEGTGMIVSPSGLVLTNNHVIDGATQVEVSLVDDAQARQTYTARVVGYDSVDDVALLKLAGASGLPTVSFGDSSQIRVGIPVLALGDAQGRGGVTPAPGDISGLDRSIQASDEGSGTTEDLNHMLQTNAQIQQGDSGGALADNAGQVIGMVTAANTPSGGQPGGTMGFAIPIDTALAIAQKIADGRSSSAVYIGEPGFLGVEVAQSNSPSPQQQAADERGSSGGNGRGGLACVEGGQDPAVPDQIAPARAGALILGILCGTAAQTQGLAAGDVIISVNGQAVTTPGSLTEITARYHPGAVVSVGWEAADGSRHRARIMLGYGPAR